MNPEELLAALQSQLAARHGQPHALSQAALAHLGLGARGAVPMSLGLAPADVHIDVALSNLATGYMNDEFIADEVVPVVNVPFRTGKFWAHDKATAYNVAAVDISSRRGRPNEVNQAVSKTDYAVKDFGLMGFVDFDTQAMADRPLNPGMMETKVIQDHLMLAREVRAASLFVAGNFSGATTALSGTGRWDNASSDPAAAVDAVLDSRLMRPNVAILGVDVARALKNHAKFQNYIQSRASYTSGATPLRVTLQQIAEAWELDRVYVPRSRVNLVADGAAVSLTRVWPSDMAAFIRVEKTPNIQATRTFAYTFRYAPPGGASWTVQSWFDQVVGVRGGTYYKVTHSDSEQIISGTDAGYLFTTVTG